MESLSSISKYFTDPVLASPSGHALLADVLIAFFQVEICRGWEIARAHRKIKRRGSRRRVRKEMAS
jgi:hypothetical protein